MASGSHNNRPPPSDPIPLQDLSSSPSAEHGRDHDFGTDQGPRQRSLLGGTASFGAELGRRISLHLQRPSYERLSQDVQHESTPPPQLLIPDLQIPHYSDAESDIPTSSQLRDGVDTALGSHQWLPPRNLNDPMQRTSRWGLASEDGYGDEDGYSSSMPDDDNTPLARNEAPIAGTDEKRSSVASVRFAGTSSRLGDDLIAAEEGLSRSGTRSRSGSATKSGPSRESSLSRAARSLSPGHSPVRRVSVAVQNMAQRVVNVSNDSEALEQTIKRKGSSKSYRETRKPRPSVPEIEIHPYDPEEQQQKPTTPHPKPFARDKSAWREQANPLKGNTLRIFSPTSRVRLILCDVLIHPATEPLILLLILIQTILLTIDSVPSVFDRPRARTWGTPVDYAMLVLFTIYTIELIARIIVSGFFLNPKQDYDPDARGGLRRRIVEKATTFLTPKKHDNSRAASPTRVDEPPSLLRSITQLNMGEANGPVPSSLQSQARFRLARRAFLRHSFNRLDFVAVVSYWISLGLCLAEVEADRHLYVFRMLSCLRILRLLGITSGTSVILRSLKKAAPLLVHVAFLIGFFWLVFAVIAVQSFKGSLQRNCVWVDPTGQQSNYVNSFQFCGGYMNATTGQAMPFLRADGSPGTDKAKGFICPPNSLCMDVGNPYSGTISFDNIIQSLELVFVVMTSNTFSDLLYYTADSDYLASAFFFIAGIIILAFWLANLLIAVITSSFQVIREESSKSAFSAEDISSIHNENEQANKKPSTIKRIYDYSHHLWVAIIAAGLFAQMFRRTTMTPREARMVDQVELAVTVFLFFEIVLRSVADWRGFHKKRRNWVDLFLAVITAIILLPPIKNSGRPYDWLTIFQILRVYRLVWAIPVTRNLLSKVLGNVSGLFNLLFFVVLLTFLCSLFVVQILRGDVPFDSPQGGTNHISFFSIWNAFLGMYQIFSSENWTTLLYSATQAQQPYGVGWISAIFLIGWFVLGNFIVLNMFIAVIQENFDVTEDEKRMYQVKAFLQNKSYKAPSQGLKLSSLFGKKDKENIEAAHSKQVAFEMLTKQAIVESFLDEGEHNNRRSVAQGANLAAAAMENLHMQEEKRQRFFQRWSTKVQEIWRDRETNPFYSFQSRSVADLAPTALAQEVVTEAERRKRAQREYLAKHPNYNVSLFIFRPTNPIRRFCQKMVGPSRADTRYDGLQPNPTLSYSFSILIYCAIVAMVVLACYTTPLYQKQYYEQHGTSPKTSWFTLADGGFVCLFTIESTIKIIADGLIWTPNAYLRGSWGIIDCVVLVTLWISVGAALTNQDEISRAVGAFKALRALRLLNISGTAQDTFHSVVVIGGKKIVSAAFVSLCLLIPFAVYGVNLFSGQMEACNDSSDGITNLSDCIFEYDSSPFQWNVLAPRAVQNPNFNFDSFGASLFTLFQIVSQEGWTNLMFNAEQIPFHSQGNAEAVFVLTLFVSVFMRNYTEQTGRTWLELRKLLRQVTPSKRPSTMPDSKWESWCYQRATHKHGYWQRGVTVLLMLHASLDRIRDWFFLILNMTFIVNIVVRVIGLTWTNFIKSKWDLYALVSVSGTTATTLLLLAGYQAPIFFLVSVVIMLIPRNDQLDHLFKTAAASLTSIGNLIATWFVLFLVYAIALTQTFGLTKIGSHSNQNMNFRTVPKALILLFRMTCGEGWNDIMSDYVVLEPSCVRGKTFFDSDCGSPVYAHALFVSWNILSMFIFVSMFISLIFESFSYVYQLSGDSSQVSREEIRRFKQAWAKFDPDGTGYIPKEQFPRLLGQLSGIFAMGIYEEPFTVHRILDDCRVDPNSTKGLTTGSVVHGIDLEALNRRIAKIPIHKIRRQRHTFTLFYEECLVSADKAYGVRFESVLLILAHYKVINDNKSLRLEEYLRRRHRLQRVEEQVQRNIVTSFFLTLYWHKRYKAVKAGKITPAAMLSRHNSVNVPQIRIDSASEVTSLVPEIRVESDIPQITINEEGPVTPPRQPSLDFGESSGFSPIESPPAGVFSFASIDPFAPRDESTLRQRGPGRRTPPYIQTPNLSPSTSPMMSPTTSPRMAPADVLGGWFGVDPERENRQSGSTSTEVAPRLVLSPLLEDSGWKDQIRSYIENEMGGVSRHSSINNNGEGRSGSVSRRSSGGNK
ncbi:Ion transport protein-domain-containing protein [Sphaerosporella brunnea]|uniref:Calcium-channel protein CCH1 n=1 Tax=Sphaerosporella brunnea TaxID=1250544 RepID=A0A5J5EP17_9PEZI|nr:Ion transport protein-domain-containing protein [Sphaerosporella brunnea]